MTLYGMYSGGINPCSGTTKDGSKCRRFGYVTDMANAFYCYQHEEKK